MQNIRPTMMCRSVTALTTRQHPFAPRSSAARAAGEAIAAPVRNARLRPLLELKPYVTRYPGQAFGARAVQRGGCRIRANDGEFTIEHDEAVAPSLKKSLARIHLRNKSAKPFRFDSYAR